mmetsp:Transcript_1610/g.5531  ORF Transcript_1610/g.5531 Transcript_1610/m.5531 type:complete len:102 (+) Transcript_1610:3588-3893(+)
MERHRLSLSQLQPATHTKNANLYLILIPPPSSSSNTYLASELHIPTADTADIPLSTKSSLECCSASVGSTLAQCPPKQAVSPAFPLYHAYTTGFLVVMMGV